MEGQFPRLAQEHHPRPLASDSRLFQGYVPQSLEQKPQILYSLSCIIKSMLYSRVRLDSVPGCLVASILSQGYRHTTLHKSVEGALPVNSNVKIGGLGEEKL